MDTTTKTPKACIGDMFPSVFPGMPMFAYVPNPYDCGRPAKVYPGDNTYYCVKGAPLCAVDAEDAALLLDKLQQHNGRKPIQNLHSARYGV